MTNPSSSGSELEAFHAWRRSAGLVAPPDADDAMWQAWWASAARFAPAPAGGSVGVEEALQWIERTVADAESLLSRCHYYQGYAIPGPLAEPWAGDVRRRLGEALKEPDGFAALRAHVGKSGVKRRDVTFGEAMAVAEREGLVQNLIEACEDSDVDKLIPRIAECIEALRAAPPTLEAEQPE